MKKIFLFCAAIVAAMNMSAAITNMTCAEAANAAQLLEHNVPGTDSVAVTGYVTFTDGKISGGQQTFWMDDEKGTKKTFQGYWCNIPGASGTSGDPINVGDKVTIKGFLLKYNSTSEMKNGDVVILERAVVHIDTIEATVCEAIEEGESLADRDYSAEVFVVTGVVTKVDETNANYYQAKFWFTCEDNDKQLQAYNVNMIDSIFPAKEDTVMVIGKLQKYGDVIEQIGKAQVVGKSTYVPDTVHATVAEAVAAGAALEKNAVSEEVYVVSGVCDSIAYAYSEEKQTMSFFMSDDANNPLYNFEAYNCKTGRDVAKGEAVTVIGYLKRYYKAADGDKPEIDLVELVNCYLDSFATSVDDVILTAPAAKFIEAGHLYIVKDGVRYNVLGAKVK